MSGFLYIMFLSVAVTTTLESHYNTIVGSHRREPWNKLWSCLMFWSNITEKGLTSAQRVYYTYKSAWKHMYVTFWNFWSQCVTVLYWNTCCKEQCYKDSPVYLKEYLKISISSHSSKSSRTSLWGSASIIKC